MNKNFKYVFLKKIDSTNNFLKENYNLFPDNSVVAADFQSGGRGRMGRSFISKDKESLTFSVKLNKSKLSAAVTLIIGIAVIRALRAAGAADFKIKWPNDILAGGKKICGILSEGCEDSFIVGIGINLFEDKEFFAENNLPFAASLLMENIHIEKNALLSGILSEIERIIKEFTENGFDGLREEYIKYSANIGKDVIIKTKSGEKTGKAIDINSNGELVVIVDGCEEIINSGEVSLINA